MKKFTLFILALLLLAISVAFAQTAAPALALSPARQEAAATSSMILASVNADKRIIAVGERGIVLLSDDGGSTFRQAKSVPVAATLSSVYFTDAKNGWIAGHWGVILHTTDAGETWTVQRSDLNVDQPLFSIYFKDAQHGWAVGLWSLMLTTDNGGASWEPVNLPAPAGANKAEGNLFQIFPDNAGGIAIASERGSLLYSADGNGKWTYLNTGYKGSLWAGMVLRDGTWLVGGLRGTILRSVDHGRNWQSISTDSKSSVTGLVHGAHGAIVATGLDGMLLTSHDNGMTFTASQRADQKSITAAVLANQSRLVMFSETGLLSESGNDGK